MWERCQIFLLDAFLGMHSDYYIYGLTVISELLRSSATSATLDWPLSERFPRLPAVYRRAYGSSSCARQPSSAVLHSSREPGELSQ